MRREDEQAIIRALAIMRVECMQHTTCKTCRFYDYAGDRKHTKLDCMLNCPPSNYDVEKIIECFT